MNLLTAEAVAERLGMDKSSVLRWFRRSKMKSVRNLALPESRGQLVAHFDAAVVERLIVGKYGEQRK